MKKNKKSYLILALMMLLSVMIPSIPVLASSSTTSSLTIEIYNSNRAVETNTISPTFKIKNTSDSPLDLKDLTVRYYYTSDGNQEQNFWCDHAGALLGYNYVDNTSKVTGKFVQLENGLSNCDTYLEIGFSDGASTLARGQEISIQTRITKADWSNYNQSNDYSFDSLNSLPTTNDKITGYISSSLVWGFPPLCKMLPPSLSASTVYYDPISAVKKDDINITLTLNNTSLMSISQGNQYLVRDTDYFISGNTVTIKNNYLIKRFSYDTKLIFSFSDGTNLPLNIYFIQPEPNFTVELGSATGRYGDTVSVPITFENVTGSNKLVCCELGISFDSRELEVCSLTAGNIVTNPIVNFSYTVSDGKIKLLFLDDTLGEQPISGNGTFANINFKIKSFPSAKDWPLKFSSIKVTTSTDTDLVEIPVTTKDGYISPYTCF